MKSPSEIFFVQYKAAAAEGAAVELKLRFLADKIPALQRYAHAQNLEDHRLPQPQLPAVCADLP